MKHKIIEILNKLVGSLDTHHGGFSGRKLTALAIIVMVAKVHTEWYEYAHFKGDFSLLGEILMIDYCMVAICLSLVTMEQITKFKNGNKDEKPIDTNTAN